MKNTLLIAGLLLGLLAFVQLRRGKAHEPDPALVASGKVASISDGQEVDLAPHLATDAWTVVEFGAVW